MLISIDRNPDEPLVFKHMGYWPDGRAVLSVPGPADIAYFDMKTGEYAKVTVNWENARREMDAAGMPFVSDMPSYDQLLSNIFAVIAEVGGESGYYLINHLIRRGRYLGKKDDWNCIAKSLHGQTIPKDGYLAVVPGPRDESQRGEPQRGELPQ